MSSRKRPNRKPLPVDDISDGGLPIADRAHLSDLRVKNYSEQTVIARGNHRRFAVWCLDVVTIDQQRLPSRYLNVFNGICSTAAPRKMTSRCHSAASTRTCPMSGPGSNGWRGIITRCSIRPANWNYPRLAFAYPKPCSVSKRPKPC